MRLVFSQVIVDALQIRCSGRGPANPHQEFSIRSMRASISPSSIKSFLSAWAIPSNGTAKPGVLFEQTQGGFPNQRLGIGTGVACNLG